MNEKNSRRVRGGRNARRELRSKKTSDFGKPYIERKIPIYDLLSDEASEIIEANADKILEQIGIDFKDDKEALEILKSNGCDIKGERVRFPKGLCREWIKNAPSEFIQHARNSNRSVKNGFLDQPH